MKYHVTLYTLVPFVRQTDVEAESPEHAELIAKQDYLGTSDLGDVNSTLPVTFDLTVVEDGTASV